MGEQPPDMVKRWKVVRKWRLKQREEERPLKGEKASCKSCSRLLESCYLDYLARNAPHGSVMLMELPSSPQPREALTGKALKAFKVVGTYMYSYIRVCKM